MRRGIALAALFGGALLGVPSVAHASGSDVVQVRGQAFRGKVVETQPGVLVRIRLDDGDELTVPWSEVVTIDGDSPPPAISFKPRPERTRPDLPRHWYGWQTLLVDAGALVMFLGGTGSQSGTLAAFGAVTYVVGPPIVHVAHGQGGQAVGSLLLRAGLPAALALAGLFIGSAGRTTNQDDDVVGPIIGAGLGLITGVLAAAAIDDAVFAWEPVQPSAAAGSGASPSIAALPKISLTGDAERGHTGWIGIGGSF